MKLDKDWRYPDPHIHYSLAARLIKALYFLPRLATVHGFHSVEVGKLASQSAGFLSGFVLMLNSTQAVIFRIPAFHRGELCFLFSTRGSRCFWRKFHGFLNDFCWSFLVGRSSYLPTCSLSQNIHPLPQPQVFILK